LCLLKKEAQALYFLVATTSKQGQLLPLFDHSPSLYHHRFVPDHRRLIANFFERIISLQFFLFTIKVVAFVEDTEFVAMAALPSSLFPLPEELILDIMEYLPVKSLSKLSAVNRDFYRLASDIRLWKKPYFSKLGPKEDNSRKNNNEGQGQTNNNQGQGPSAASKSFGLFGSQVSQESMAWPTSRLCHVAVVYQGAMYIHGGKLITHSVNNSTNFPPVLVMDLFLKDTILCQILNCLMK